MVKVNKDVKGKPLPCELYLDGYLKENLDALNQFVLKDWDGIGFIIGYEGDGKSVLALQMGLYLDNTFNLDKVVFNPQQFEEAVDKAEKYSCIVWDEADDLGQGWQSEILRTLKAKFKRIRSKNLFILLVTPTIFDLNKYFVIHRTRFAIHVHSKGTERGYIRFFNRERKKKLYIYGRKEWNLSVAKPNFIGRFANIPPGFVIDMKDYNDKKDEAAQEIIEEGKESKRLALKNYRIGCLRRLNTLLLQKYNKTLEHSEYSTVFKVQPDTIRKDFNSISQK